VLYRTKSWIHCPGSSWRPLSPSVPIILFPFLALIHLNSELRFYDGWVMCALISFPFMFCLLSLSRKLAFLYQANFVSRIDGAAPFIKGVRARLLLIQGVISQLQEILGPSLVTLDLGVHLWHPGHVFYCRSMC
jgi:hypothetical protein